MRVLVIGSGLAGVTTAWFLRQHGAEVHVVDRCAAAAMETSHANAGMLTPSMCDPWNQPGLLLRLLKWIGREDSPMLLRPAALPAMLGWGLRFLRNSSPARHRESTLINLRLASYSLDTLRKLRADLGLEYDGLTNGTLKFFRERETYEEFLELAKVLQSHGVQYRALSGGELVALEPSLAPIRAEIVGGLHFPGDESGDARRFCEALTARARQQGVVYHFNEDVRRIVAQDGRFHAVETAANRWEADACVVAAGSYSPQLVKPLGIKLPVYPVKGYSITLPFGDWHPRPRMPIVDDTLHVAATPLGDKLRVAGTAELAGWDTRIRSERIANLLRFAGRLFPTLPTAQSPDDISGWAGLRPMSCDGIPVLGATRIARLYLATGYGHLGWTMASGAGKLVADQVLDQPAELEAAPFGMGRFG